MKKIVYLISSTLLLQSVAAFASQTAATAPISTSGTAYIGQVLFGLMGVLLLILGLAWLLKRFGQGAMLGSQHMKVLATMPLGTRERLLLVDVAGQQILLGVSAGRITNLHSFDVPVIAQDDSSGHSDFAAKLREIMQAGLKKGGEVEPFDDKNHV
jgi:flagellar protein FliO/FliZ